MAPHTLPSTSSPYSAAMRAVLPWLTLVARSCGEGGVGGWGRLVRGEPQTRRSQPRMWRMAATKQALPLLAAARAARLIALSPPPAPLPAHRAAPPRRTWKDV